MDGCRIEQAAAAQRAEFEALKAEIESVKAPQAQQAVRDEWQKAFSIVQKDHEDFLTNAERILVEVAPQYDTTTNTSLIAAQMLFEILCVVARGRG